jgi:hypothetical protein
MAIAWDHEIPLAAKIPSNGSWAGSTQTNPGGSFRLGNSNFPFMICLALGCNFIVPVDYQV